MIQAAAFVQRVTHAPRNRLKTFESKVTIDISKYLISQNCMFGDQCKHWVHQRYMDLPVIQTSKIINFAKV